MTAKKGHINISCPIEGYILQSISDQDKTFEAIDLYSGIYDYNKIREFIESCPDITNVSNNFYKNITFIWKDEIFILFSFFNNKIFVRAFGPYKMQLFTDNFSILFKSGVFNYFINYCSQECDWIDDNCIDDGFKKFEKLESEDDEDDDEDETDFEQ